MEAVNREIQLLQMQVVRYQGKWYKIVPKPYEPEKQTYEISWNLIKQPNLAKEEAYRTWYQKQREIVKVLYPSFRKDGDSK
jgi:hypothetical protein